MSGFALPLLFVSAILAALIIFTHLRHPQAHRPAIAWAGLQLRALGPRIPFALVAAECLGRLLPRDHVAALLGEQAGLVGTLLASVTGSLLPGGPMVAFPLAIALSRAGAGQAPLVALVTAWALVAVNRTLLFEVPMLGPRFALARMLVSAPLPVAAGLLAAAIVTVAA